MTFTQRQHLAAMLGLIGGALGLIAGGLQASFSDRLDEWTGNKANPVALGLLAMLLSVVSMASAVVLLRNKSELPAGRRLALATGLLVPGGLCFSSTGALWYLPGCLLIGGGVAALSAGNAHHARAALAHAWPALLVSVLGALELLMAVSAGPPVTIVVGVIGGLSLVAAPWLSSRPIRLALFIIGTVPFAVLTWWSVASPLLAVAALTIGLTTLRSRPTVDPQPKESELLANAHHRSA